MCIRILTGENGEELPAVSLVTDPQKLPALRRIAQLAADEIERLERMARYAFYAPRPVTRDEAANDDAAEEGNGEAGHDAGRLQM